MAKKKRRAYKRDYENLFDDPTALFGKDCRVILWPNGQPEIWLQSEDGRYGVTITAGHGKAGFGVTVRAQSMRPPLALSGNLAPEYESFPTRPGTMPEFKEINVCQYHQDEYGQAFKAWYEGNGRHPDETGDKS